MLIAAETTTSPSLLGSTLSEFSGPFRASAPCWRSAFRCNCAIAGFRPLKILAAATHACLDVYRGVHPGQPIAGVELGLQVLDNRVNKPRDLRRGTRGRRSGCGNGDLA
jgi:hypothetical protein